MSKAPNTFIKPSKIHGLGLFAKQDIKSGAQIFQGLSDFSYYGEWIGYVKKWKEKSFAYNNGFCMVNHSDSPNTKRNDKMGIITVRKVLQGEEITEDYNDLPEGQNPFIYTFQEDLYRFCSTKRKIF